MAITLDAAGDGGTALVMEMRLPSASALDDALEYGAGEGATQALGRLADHLAGGRVAAP